MSSPKYKMKKIVGPIQVSCLPGLRLDFEWHKFLQGIIDSIPNGDYLRSELGVFEITLSEMVNTTPTPEEVLSNNMIRVVAKLQKLNSVDDYPILETLAADLCLEQQTVREAINAINHAGYKGVFFSKEKNGYALMEYGYVKGFTE